MLTCVKGKRVGKAQHTNEEKYEMKTDIFSFVLKFIVVFLSFIYNFVLWLICYCVLIFTNQKALVTPFSLSTPILFCYIYNTSILPHILNLIHDSPLICISEFFFSHVPFFSLFYYLCFDIHSSIKLLISMSLYAFWN